MADRQHFSDLLTPGFRQIYNDRYSEVAMMLEKLFNVTTSDKADEKDSSVSGFGLAPETGEGQPIQYEDPEQGYDTTYSHRKYAKGFKITQEMFDDDLYNIMNKRPAALGRAMRRTSEDQASLIFRNGFSTSYLGADGKPLFSTSHSRADGGTAQSNASSTGIALTEGNLETSIIAMRQQLDDKGMKIDVYPKILLVPIELRKTAHLIIDSAARQGTADNDVNIYKNEFTIVDWLYLTSTTAWFMIDTEVDQLNWFWRKKAAFQQDELFDTEVAVYKSSMRLSRGWSDWRGTWGSQGAGAAFAD